MQPVSNTLPVNAHSTYHVSLTVAQVDTESGKSNKLDASGDQVDAIQPNTKPFYLFSKRLFDIIVSGLVLLLLSPIMLITAIAIKIEDPKGKIFYNAPRGGEMASRLPA